MVLKTNKQHFYEAKEKIARSNECFIFEILPTITLDEFDALCLKRPHVYKKYEGYVKNYFAKK